MSPPWRAGALPPRSTVMPCWSAVAKRKRTRSLRRTRDRSATRRARPPNMWSSGSRDQIVPLLQPLRDVEVRQGVAVTEDDRLAITGDSSGADAADAGRVTGH